MTFEQWFSAQHGNRPSKQPLWEIADQVQRANYEAARLQALYRACESWDEKQTSALYAWQIADADKSA